MDNNTQKSSLSGGLSFSLLIFLFTIFLLSFSGFIFHIGINPFYSVLGFLAGIISLYFYFKPDKLLPADKKNFYTGVILYSFLILTSFYIASFFFDPSWDGKTYHQAGVILLSKGWNPIYDNINEFCMKLFNSTPMHLICVENYPKFVEIIQAGLYTVFKNMEAVKMTVWLSMAIVFSYSFYIFSKNYFNKINMFLKLAFSLVITLNPVVMAQFTNFYTDSYLYLFFAVMLMSIIDIETGERKRHVPFSVMIMSSVCLLNVKLGGILCVFLTYFIYLIYLCFKKDKRKIINIITAIFITVLLGLISGINPYFTNINKNRHPFYPVMGINKMDFMPNNTPLAFKNHNRLRNLIISTFSKVKDHDKESKQAEIKFPFFILKGELVNLSAADNRFCGFGIFWSGILLLAFILIPFIRYGNKSEKELNILILTILTSLVLINPYSWWARYAPYFWLIPVVICIPVSMKQNKTKIEMFIIYLITVLSLISVFIQANFVIDGSLYYKKNLGAFLNSIENYKKDIKIYNIYDWSFIAKFEENNIPVKYVSFEDYAMNKDDFSKIPLSLDGIMEWDYKE